MMQQVEQLKNDITQSTIGAAQKNQRTKCIFSIRKESVQEKLIEE
jgi:hypothetical protein